MGYEFSDGRSWTTLMQEPSGIFLLREGGGGSQDAPVVKEKTSLRNKEKKAVFCRGCSHQITHAQKVFSVNGSQTHTFFNPAGIVFEIICFTEAPGCVLQGEASSEFAWFPGHTWRLAICGSCFTHLGWFFEFGDSSFYGLIVKKLAGDL
jgi:hypothetical protein